MPVPTPARPVIPRRLHKDAVYDHLVEAVLDGTLRPGERLRDADCEDWLGVSRTPIRVALAKLEHVRLVESTGGRSTVVVIPRRETALDLLSCGCALLMAALDSLPGARGGRGRAEVATRLRAVAEACVTAPTGRAATTADAVAVAWHDLWSAMAGLRAGGLVVRHARRLGLPLRHHLRDLAPSDLARLACLASDAAGKLEGADPRTSVLSLARAVASLGGPADRAGEIRGGPRASSSGDGVRPRAARVPEGEPPARDLSVRRRLSEEVHDIVLTAVLDGTLAPGERLVDDELIAWLGVSRTPIRHAVERLDETGLVELAPNRYTRVARPAVTDVLAARDLHATLVSWSAALAAAGGPDADGPGDGGPDDDVRAAVARLDAIGRRAEGRVVTLAFLSCLAPIVRRAASTRASQAISYELDLLEPRLAHGVVSCGFTLAPGTWRTFSRAVEDSTPGPAVAALVRGLCPPSG